MQLNLPLPELAELFRAAPTRASDRIYCNRSLRLDQIDWVGFDMDYTLAVYRQQEMNRLSIEATVVKLVERGWTDALLHMPYRTDFPVRGLLIDRRLGNVLKMDRYRYVKRAYHGMRELTKEERRRHYHTRPLRPGSARFHFVDTLYALPEVALYAAAVESIDADGLECDYDRLFGDIRECIDLSHRDGTILDPIVSDLPRYVVRDPELGATLHQLRSSGKKLFLLTNSQPAYTEAMMRYLLGAALTEYASWRGYFDLVIADARKPSFFTGTEPFEREDRSGRRAPASSLDRGAVLARGNLAALQGHLGVSPDRVLYVGDHIFGDVLRAKKDSIWRTLMVIQEMDGELDAHEEIRNALVRLDDLEQLRVRLLEELREHQRAEKLLRRKRDTEGLSPGEEGERVRQRRGIDRLRLRLKATEREYTELEAGASVRFHPFWGSLFKTGPEVSSFGHQVEDYACLYATRATCLRHYSPMHFFQSPRDRMPHEL